MHGAAPARAMRRSRRSAAARPRRPRRRRPASARRARRRRPRRRARAPPPRPLDDLVQRGRLPVLDVHAHLHERPHAAGRARARAHPGTRRRARARPPRSRARPRRRAAQVDVEGDQRPPRADEHGARARVEPRRPEVRRELAVVEPTLQLGRPAACGRTPARGPARARRRGRPAGQLVAEPRAPTSSAHVRARSMSSGTIGTTGTTSAAPIRGCAPSCSRRSIRSRANGDRRDERVRQLCLRSDEREDRPVVVGVAVHVEQPRVPLDRIADRGDRRAVAPFREVRHGFEDAHARTLGSH